MTIYKLSKLIRFNNTEWFDEELVQYFSNFSDAEKVRDVLESVNDRKEQIRYVLESVVSSDINEKSSVVSAERENDNKHKYKQEEIKNER